MSVIHKTISTKMTAVEMKDYINQHLLTRKDVSALLNTNSKLGDGTIVLTDNKLEITFSLSFFGKLARKRIEANFDDIFKQLPPKV
ncbi:MAG: hypothetical protein HYZ54_06700 [Ignavibacteriae bacterium]|nr:hypothetical protein [Ignavibacteriota bacterium]